MSAHLTFSTQGQTRKLPCGAVFTIGREFSSDLVLDDKEVSRHHAVIRRLGSGDYYIIDSGSANGTRVNGNCIRVPTLLKHNDVLTIGAFQATFISSIKPRPYSLYDMQEDAAMMVRETPPVFTTVLTAYIRGFAVLSCVPVQRITGLAYDWFHVVADCVQGYRGTLDKIIEDRIYALWKHDMGTDHSIIRALYTAREIHSATQSLWKKNSDLPFPLRLGVGITNEQEFSDGQGGAAIGDVNFALALQSEFERLQKDILISKSAYENLPPRFWREREKTLGSDGTKEPVSVVGYTFEELGNICDS